jgi:hypothetical protein
MCSSVFVTVGRIPAALFPAELTSAGSDDLEPPAFCLIRCTLNIAIDMLSHVLYILLYTACIPQAVKHSPT